MADRRLEAEQQGDERPQGKLPEGPAVAPTTDLTLHPPKMARRLCKVRRTLPESRLRHAAECIPVRCATLLLDFACGSQSPSLLMPVWVGFSVTFNRRNQISGSKISCLLSRHIALSHICKTRWATAVPLREKRCYSFHVAEEHHPGLQRNTKQEGRMEESLGRGIEQP